MIRRVMTTASQDDKEDLKNEASKVINKFGSDENFKK